MPITLNAAQPDDRRIRHSRYAWIAETLRLPISLARQTVCAPARNTGQALRITRTR